MFAELMTGSLYTQDIGLLWEDTDYLGSESLVNVASMSTIY
jgi:CRISPR-associated endonuclease/helicase Cas3